MNEEYNETIDYRDIRNKVNKNTIQFMVELGKPRTEPHTFDNDEKVEENITNYITNHIDEAENIIKGSLEVKFYENIYGNRFARVTYDVYELNKDSDNE